MKSRFILGICFFLLLFAGCFEDNGNYDYVEVSPPTWLINIENENINVVARSGEVVSFKASDKFVWEKDSAKREANVRYEWKLNDVVISDQVDFEMPTLEVMEKAGVTDFDQTGVFGSFNIIEKETGITYMVRMCIFFNPEFAVRDWFVLSEDGGNTKLSAMIVKYRVVDGKQQAYYELRDNCYEEKNGSKIPGKPIMLNFARAKHIGTMGASTVITDQVAYEVNNDNMEKVGELKDQFLDGTPPDFNVVARREIDPSGQGYPPCSFVATEKGEVFMRRMTPNYLGGKFLTEPYFLDAKGYKITKFGHSLYAGSIPCYDEKNRRVVLAAVTPVLVGSNEDGKYYYRAKLIPLEKPKNMKEGDFVGVPFWDMPEGTKVLYISQSKHLISFGRTVNYAIFYNDADGKSWVGEFAVDYENLTSSYQQFVAWRWQELPRQMTEESVIAMVANSKNRVTGVYRDFYSIDNEVYFLQWSDSYVTWRVADNPFMKLDSKVTYIGFETYDTDNTIIVFGCQNGDVLAYDIRDISRPQEVFRANVGGKVMAIKELGTLGYSTRDYY